MKKINTTRAVTAEVQKNRMVQSINLKKLGFKANTPNPKPTKGKPN